MGRVLVLGSIITDLVARATHLPVPGESLIGSDFGTFLGGKGFNQAVAAARLGASVTLIGRVGTDAFGDAFFPVLAQEGIDSTHLVRDPEIGSGVACVMIGADSGQNAIIVLPQANLAIQSKDVEQAMRAILAQQSQLQGGVFMAQCEMRMPTVAAGLKLAHNVGMTTIFNLAPIPREPLVDDMLSFVDILVVNESEAAALANLPIDSPANARAAAEVLLQQGPRHIIITLGAQGSVWSTHDTPKAQPTHFVMPAIPMKQVDATAAGDAFCGAMAASLANGATMQEALRVAGAAGALTVTRVGTFPSIPTIAEIKTLLGEQ